MQQAKTDTISGVDTPKAIAPTPPTEQEVLEYKRRLIETADRSFVNDRLNVSLPDHLHGEWIGIDDFSQFNAQMKGFTDGSEFLTNMNRLHERPDGPTVGDVKFMVIPKWKHEANVEHDRLRSEKNSGLSADAGQEYDEYAASVGLGQLNEGKPVEGRTISGEQLNALIKG